MFLVHRSVRRYVNEYEERTLAIPYSIFLIEVNVISKISEMRVTVLLFSNKASIDLSYSLFLTPVFLEIFRPNIFLIFLFNLSPPLQLYISSVQYLH